MAISNIERSSPWCDTYDSAEKNINTRASR